MKTKNLILALVAIVFAVGSAFTSKNVDLANNIKIWQKQLPASPYACTAVPLECVTTGGIACTVSIMKANGTPEVVTAFNAIDALCATPLTHTGASAGSYDAGAGERPVDVANSQSGE